MTTVNIQMTRTTLDINGPISIIEYGGTGPLAVCVHGLEGSALNWHLIAEDLTRTHTVVAPDLQGFGYTEPIGRSASVEANAALVGAIIDHYGGPALLVGNSMGGLISILAAGRYPDRVSALVLVDPAGPVINWSRLRPRTAVTLGISMIPGLGPAAVEQYQQRLTPEQAVMESYRFVAADHAVIPDSVFADALEIADLRRQQPWSARSLAAASRSIAPYVLVKGRFLRALHQVTQPTLLIQGTSDPVVQPETAVWMARQRPDWTVAYLVGVGHVPMVEAPTTMMQVFRTWQESLPSPV